MAHKVQRYHCSKSNGYSGKLNCVPFLLHTACLVFDTEPAMGNSKTQYHYTTLKHTVKKFHSKCRIWIKECCM